MSKLNLNIDSLIGDLVSRQLVHPFWPAALRALSAPIKDLNEDLVDFEAEINELLSFNGQVMVLERMLNLRYYGVWSNTLPNPIYIADLPGARTLYLFPEEENNPLFLHPEEEEVLTYLFPEEELATATNGFIVNVPASLVFDLAQMRGLINRYRVAGTTYQINLYP